MSEIENYIDNHRELFVEKPDMVNHPKHYNSDPSGIECIDVIKHRDFCTGNAMKYLWRCGLKEEEGMTDKEKEIQDLNKAIWYIIEEIKLKGGKVTAKLD